jgi:hypothetical protein
MRLVLGLRSSVFVLALWWLSAVPTEAMGQQAGTVDVLGGEAIERAQLQLGSAIKAASSPPVQARRRRPRSASSSNVGYVDNAIVGNMFTLRYDNAREAAMPDMAEFIYAKCGCYRVLGLDPDAPGPAGSLSGGDPLQDQLIEPSLDFQDVTLDAEIAFSDRFSVFAEIPYRSVRGEVLMDGSGIADIQAGFKYALVATEDRYLTFQGRVYLPTGDPAEGLGTDHASVEPGLLYHEGSGDRLKLDAEVRLWIPTGGSSNAGLEVVAPAVAEAQDNYYGNVLRYGVGLSYDVSPDASVRVTPVVELVAWRILSGAGLLSPDGTPASAMFVDASGTNIANIKVGFRFGIRERDSIFAGYGKALTDTWWYDDIFRIEYRLVP